jgi:outer membrane protein assembly factor BamB
VTIGTECPHCESVFQVAAELAGKSMRCPNPTCREVFNVAVPTVAAAPVAPLAEVPSIPELPVPAPVAGTVADYLPVFEAERINPPAKVYDAEPLESIPRAKPMPAAAPIPKAAPLPPVANAPRAPQILDWSAEQDEPGRKQSRRRDRDDESDVPIRTQPRGMGLTGKVVFGSLLVLLVLVLGGTLAVLLLSKAKSEGQEAAAADALFQEAKYTEAKRKFDTLAADFPDSGSVPKYKFFSTLSQTQADASSVTVKDDPTAAQKSLAGLITEYADSPLVQPNSGYGADVVLAGKKVAGAVADHAAERVKQFQAKRSELKLLDAAEKAIADGRAILPTLEKFRDKSGLSLDDERAKFDTVEGSVRKERDRLAALEPWRDLATDPTDVRIDQFEKAMKAAGLDKDGEAQLLAAKAKKALRDGIKYEVVPQAAGNPPLETGATLSAAARVAGTPDVRLPTGKADAVFGIAHGVLYALDHRTGAKLWAERVSAEARAADAPLRITVGDGEEFDWVLVPSLQAGQAALTARVTMRGEARWHQPLPAPVLGKPVRIGDRLIVPLADDRGTLLQLNAHDGTQLGKVELRQPIGGGISALRGNGTNHGFLVVPADARRVFVFEVGKPGEDGKRQPPQVMWVIATGHTRGSLRGPPLVIDPDDPAQPRRVILAQSDGPTEMKLRSFPLPPIAELGQALLEGDVPPAQMAEASVGGWSWFPPLSDGERVAVCTDKGVFAAFGLNLPGQADKPLYQLPGQSPDADPIAISRSQVVWMDEDTFWVIVNGKLVRLKVATDPRGGMKIVPAQENRPVGEPVAAAQVRPADGIAVITTKATETGTLHLQAFDVNTGEEVWRRQLGAVAAAPPVMLADSTRLLVDECGGIHKAAADATEWTPMEKCEPAVGCVSPAVTATSLDGGRVWVAVHVPSAEGVKLLVRVLRDGKPEGDERTITIPAGLAGNAVAVGEHLLFPLANKFIYRIGVKDTEPTQGPAWAGAKAKPGARCHLSASADGLIVFGDGDTQLLRRKWASDKPEAEKAGGPWELTSPMTTPAVSITAGGKEWLIAADNFGVGAFDPSKPTTDPVRRWQGGNAELPIGRATHLVAVGGKVCWSAGGRAVALADPDADKPLWVYPVPNAAGDVVGLTPDGEGVLVTLSSGVVLELNAAGEEKAEASLPVGGPLAKAAAVRVGDREVLLPLADGTASRLPWKKR